LELSLEKRNFIYLFYDLHKQYVKECKARPKCPGLVEQMPDITYFKPRGVLLSKFEVDPSKCEALRLVDLEGMRQEMQPQE